MNGHVKPNATMQNTNELSAYRPLAHDYRSNEGDGTITGLDFSKLSPAEAKTVWGSFRASREALRATLNSPACIDDGNLNRSGEQIEILLDAINVKMVEILDHAMCMQMAPDDWEGAAARSSFVFEAIADAGLGNELGQQAFDAVRSIIAARPPFRD